jgi:hypothetical protein
MTNLIAAIPTSCIGDTCGWIAALIALFAAGTYGVPIKETVHQIPDLNPFVFQTYKVVVFFIVSLVSVLALQIPIRMTFFYGTLSGFLWVCGGTGGIIAVRFAGLATAVGTWASIMICVNFTWGILVFHEPIANIYNTITAFGLLSLGLIGMSIYGDPSNSKSLPTQCPTNVQNSVSTTDLDEFGEDGTGSTHKKDHDRSAPSRRNTLSINSRNRSYSDDEMDGSENTITSSLLKQRKTGGITIKGNDEETAVTENDSDSSACSTSSLTVSQQQVTCFNPDTHVRLCGTIIITKRLAGIVAAIFNGFMSGSSLIPMHFAKGQGGWGGLNYLISFSIGSMLSCGFIWFIYYNVLAMRIGLQRNKKSNTVSNPGTTTTTNEESSLVYTLQQAASKMPEIHWKTLWKSGLAAGLLNAIGMVGSVLAVTYLGQGVGNSVIQCKIIVRYVSYAIEANTFFCLFLFTHKLYCIFFPLTKKIVGCGGYFITKKSIIRMPFVNGLYLHY